MSKQARKNSKKSRDQKVELVKPFFRRMLFKRSVLFFRNFFIPKKKDESKEEDFILEACTLLNITELAPSTLHDLVSRLPFWLRWLKPGVAEEVKGRCWTIRARFYSLPIAAMLYEKTEEATPNGDSIVFWYCRVFCRDGDRNFFKEKLECLGDKATYHARYIFPIMVC